MFGYFQQQTSSEIPYAGSFLVTFVYNIFRQNGQFWDKNISFELPFLGKWQKRLILMFVCYKTP